MINYSNATDGIAFAWIRVLLRGTTKTTYHIAVALDTVVHDTSYIKTGTGTSDLMF